LHDSLLHLKAFNPVNRVTLTSKTERIRLGSDEIWQVLLKYRYGENLAGYSAQSHPTALAYFAARQQRLQQAMSSTITKWNNQFFDYLNEDMDVRLEAHITPELCRSSKSLVAFYKIHNCPATCPFNYLRGAKYEEALFRAIPNQ